LRLQIAVSLHHQINKTHSTMKIKNLILAVTLVGFVSFGALALDSFIQTNDQPEMVSFTQDDDPPAAKKAVSSDKDKVNKDAGKCEKTKVNCKSGDVKCKEAAAKCPAAKDCCPSKKAKDCKTSGGGEKK